MSRARDRGGRDVRAAGRATQAGPTPGEYPIDSGTARLVQDRDNPLAYLLLINGAESSHIDLSDPTWLDFEYMRWIAAVIEHRLPDPLRVLHLGAAACSLARYLIGKQPASQHLAVDTDAELSRLVREWFDLPRAPALRIRIGDAREVTQSLAEASQTVVVRDVFADALTPAPLTTVEFTAAVRRVLRPGGLYLLNCVDKPDLHLTRSEAVTVGSVFEHVSVIADPPMLKGRRYGNVIVVGSDSPIGSPALARELLSGAVPAQLWEDRRVRDFSRAASVLRDSAGISGL